MTAALLYRQNQRWQIWAAFGGAVLVHWCAVAIATNPPGDASLPPAEVPAISIEFLAASEDPPPVATVEDLPVPPPPAVEEVFMAEENPTPTPIRRRPEKPSQSLVRPAGTRRSASAPMSSAKVLAVVAPRPEYPYEARRERTSGSGVAVLSIDPPSGSVIEVSMVRSTGSPVLDHATISGFRRWRFKPGTVSPVQSPITYTLTGATY